MGQRPFSSRCRLPKNGKLIRTVETVKQGDTLDVDPLIVIG